MSKQFSTHFVSWRDADKGPWGIVAHEHEYRAAAAKALEVKLNILAQEGWIIDQILPSRGINAKDCASFTVVAFK